MKENIGILRDYQRGHFTVWLYLRTHLRRTAERHAQAAFLARYGRWPRMVQRLNYVTWVAGPLAEGETETNKQKGEK